MASSKLCWIPDHAHFGCRFLGEDAVRELGHEILVDSMGFLVLALVPEDAGLGEQGDGGNVTVRVFRGDLLVAGDGIFRFALGVEGLGDAKVSCGDEGMVGVFVDERLEGLDSVVEVPGLPELASQKSSSFEEVARAASAAVAVCAWL
jgi:hypothetical protein